MKYEYLPIERHIVVNDSDPDLFPIKVDVLDVIQRTYKAYGLKPPEDFPPMKEVSGYGLPPEDQVFEREVIPDGLLRIERTIRNELKREKRMTSIKLELTLINRFWEVLELQPEKYAAELEWIARMWRYRLLGKYVFIKGRVTWIPGHYHWYLNWIWLDDTRPEYRHWDMIKHVFVSFCEYDTTTFKNIDPQNRKPIPNENGQYEMIDIGQRVCAGVNGPKSRRVGDTSDAQSIGMERAMRSMEFHFGTQGRNEAHALKIFQQQFVRPWEKLPIFFRAMWDSNLGIKPREHLLFDGDSPDFGLHTRVTHALSANAENYNGDKLGFYNRDEAGNFSGEDVNKGHKIVKFCMSLGDKIIGFCFYTTTVEEIEAGSAGENYMNLCFDSQYEIRDENGRTASWMYNLFIPAEYRMEGYIDKWGFPVVDDPTPEQARFIGKNYGAVKFIDNTVKELSRKKDWTSLAIFQRQYPRKFRDCFSPPGKNQFFNVELLRNRIQHCTFANRSILPERGDFIWSSGFGSDVLWRPNDSGRWYKSRDFLSGETNKRRQVAGVWYPDDKLSFVHSADTFGQDRTLGRASLGGIACRWRHDVNIDPITKDSTLWKSNRLIITYKFRPDTVEEFCEDALKQNIYCGGMMYPERNKADVIHYYRRNGYEGYLLYDVDRNTGKPKAEAGWWCKDEIKIRLFNLVRDEILKNGERCTHVDWMEECTLIRDPKDMTNYDLFTCVGGTLLAELNPWYTFMAKARKSFVNTKNFLPESEY